jgi:hypothetical protein
MTIIKLGKQAPNPKLDDFMKDYWEHTTQHPWTEQVRIFQNKVALEVRKFGSKIHIGDISTLAPKSGAGTEALKFLTALADKHGVTLEGIAKAYHTDKSKITSTPRLVQWYQKHGFIIGDGDKYDGYDIHYIGFGRFTQGNDPHVAFIKKDGVMHRVTKSIKEDAPTNCISSGAIAGAGIGPMGQPPIYNGNKKLDKKRKKIIMDTMQRRKEIVAESNDPWMVKRKQAGEYDVYHDGRLVGHVYSNEARVYTGRALKNQNRNGSYSSASYRTDISWDARNASKALVAQGMGSKKAALEILKQKAGMNNTPSDESKTYEVIYQRANDNGAMVALTTKNLAVAKQFCKDLKGPLAQAVRYIITCDDGSVVHDTHKDGLL